MGVHTYSIMDGDYSYPMGVSTFTYMNPLGSEHGPSVLCIHRGYMWWYIAYLYLTGWMFYSNSGFHWNRQCHWTCLELSGTNKWYQRWFKNIMLIASWRMSGAYFQWVMYNVLGMIRQLGISTWFLTCSGQMSSRQLPDGMAPCCEENVIWRKEQVVESESSHCSKTLPV